MSEQTSAVRKRVIYAGRVQGVGFRYTCERLAAPHQVAGWVRNEPDGTVRLEVEGPREAVEGVLGDIAEHFRTHIRESTTQDIDPTGRETRFEIRY